MFLALVQGAVVATKKDPSMNGRKLLLLRPQLVDEKDPSRFRPGVNTIIAVDSVGAGVGEMVLFCQGSSARLAPSLKEAPVDAVIIGIVDSVDVLGKEIYNAKT
jgi:ethanolamine utilization protein EutN